MVLPPKQTKEFFMSISAIAQRAAAALGAVALTVTLLVSSFASPQAATFAGVLV
jgi:hypothetical protein